MMGDSGSSRGRKKMFKKTWWTVAGGLVIASMLLAACAAPAAPTAETVQVEVTRVIEKEGETVVEVEQVVVTATPEPEMAVEYKSADPNTLYNITGAGDTVSSSSVTSISQ